MSSGYGSGQRMPSQQTYEAPACVQNAMMTKDKKPFTYTPGGIDLSQIKSERMAKRLARNAQNEGATGLNQQNRPTQPQSPGGTSPSAAAAMGAAAMGMPFQVLPPPPPPPGTGKNFSGGSGPAPPPPPPPSSSSNFSNTGTLAPPTSGNAGGGRGSAPNSPNMPRKSPTPQSFQPPPLGFRPEIKIPPNPMAALRKVPPPVEKNTFWKDEYVKDRSKSPMVEATPANNNNTEPNDSVNNSNSSSPTQTTNAYNNGAATISNDNIDGFKKTMPTTNTTNNAAQYNPQTNNNTYTNYQQNQQQQQQQQQQMYTPPTPNQSPLKPMQQSPQYTGTQTPSPIPQQQSNLSRPEFRSVAAPTSPAVNIYTRQTDSPRSMENTTPPNRATESPFKFAQQQQQQQSQQRAPPTVSPLAQQSTPSSASSGASVSPNPQAQATTVPWRNQRAPSQQQQQQPAPSVLAQSHPQPIYNNVQQPVQKSPDFSTQPMPYQGPKPTNVGSLYIAPLAPPTEPQAQHIVRQQLQQQQQQRDSPMRQVAPTQPQQPGQQLRWMSTQPQAKEQQPAWARPEENGNVVPSSLNRIKSPPTVAAATVQPGNGYVPPPPAPAPAQNFGAHPPMSTGLRLQISTPAANTQAQTQNGPREHIIPIQLEQTPTYAAAQPSFNTQAQQYAGGNNAPATAPGYIVRTPNQFVDQGYHNFGQQHEQQQPQPQRVMSPTVQQLNAPRIVQQTQNNVAGHKTHIIPIAVENNEGTRGPIVKTPIVIPNDQRTPPIQSKSFRILQKITDTIDDANNNDDQQQLQQQQQQQAEPQLQRPTFARQMSAQQARHSPTVEQMRRMQIGQEQGKSAPSTPLANKYYEQQQRYLYDNSQQYIPPSEQQVTEPKKYTGSAIPSRSFKILQAMTQPENAEEQQISQINQNQNQNQNQNENQKQNQNQNNEMNDSESEAERHRNSFSTSSSTVEPVSSCSSSSISSELAFSSASASRSPSPTPPPTQPLPYPPYAYPYGYPWYPPPPLPPHMANQGGENTNTPVWPYPYGMPTTNTPPLAPDHANHYPPYPYYYPHPYYAPIPPMNSNPLQNNNNAINYQPSEQDLQNMYAPYMPPPPPYMAYPYPVAPSYSQSTTSSRASSVLPDIIITPSTDDIPSQVILKHHIKVKKEEKPKRAGSLEIDEMSTIKSNKPGDGCVVDILTQHLENINKNLENNLDSKRQAKKSYKKNIEQKSPEDNTSPVQITMVQTDSEKDLESEEDSDSEVTPKQVQKNGPVRLQSIKSVNNVKVYQGKPVNKESELSSSESDTESETEDEDDETTADGESDIFDEEEVEEEENQFVLQNGQEVSNESESDSEEFLIDDSLSVIYEEESEMEKSSDMAKTVIQGDGSTEHLEDMDVKIEENDCDDEEEHEDSASVTVRLPLKFSFSKTKDAENIATVEVGKSHIEEQRKSTDDEQRNSFIEQQRKSTGDEQRNLFIEQQRESTTVSDEQRNSFSVATVKSDSDSDSDSEGEEYDDCDISVTISLTPSSSKSNSLDCHKEHKNLADIYPIEDMPLPEETLENIETSQEDVSVSFSLNMRNKFANETGTTNSEITNNLANLENLVDKKEEVAKVEEHPEELDFFATLMATKMQAQKIKEQSASYWGKSTESKVENKEEGKLSDQDKPEAPKEEKAKVSHDLGKQNSAKKTEEPQNKANYDFGNQNLEKKTEEQEAKARLDFWNQYSQKKSESETKSKEVENVKSNQVEESNGGQTDFWNKYSNKAKMLSSEETEKTQVIEDIWANKTDEKLVAKNETNNEIKKPKFSFWDHCSKTTKEEEAKKTDCQTLKKSQEKEVKKANCPTPEKSQEGVQKADCQAPEKPQEVEDVSTRNPKEKVSKPKKVKKSSKTKKTSETAKKSEEIKPIANGVCETTSTTNNSAEVVDIWADRVDDLPPIKPIKVKLTSLESAKNSFWSTVAETQKPPEEIKKTLPRPQTVQKIAFSVPTLTSQVHEVIQPQQAAQHYEEAEELHEELPEQEEEIEEEEVDFWAEIEKSRDSKTPEPNAFMSTFGEQEYSMYNDDHEPAAFDPFKYPEEPREVDTDEEIDFWAEIEAKRQAENDVDDVTFHKSASFWASRDRHNSVEETPYTPVVTKAFKARLPDEPPCADLNIWQALEAHKGEEPVIVDPAVEEEKALVQEYEEMVENNQDDDAYSVHQPVEATVWGNEIQDVVQQELPETETDYWSQIEAQKQLETAHVVQEPETDYWSHIEAQKQLETAHIAQESETDYWSHIEAQKQQETGHLQQEQEIEKESAKEIEKESDTKTVRDELEIKRNNYRKAMAFFTTSIDDNKEQSTERYERSKSKSLRNSAAIDEESEKWDWEAVNEALQHETKQPVQEEATATPVDMVEVPATLEKEATPLPEIYVEPKVKRLANGLPDLEVNKFNEERKISVKDRISAFETGSMDKDSSDERKNSIKNQSLSVESYTRQSSLSRNSSTQRSESEMDEDDSGVTDMNKQLSETDTESESFPELKKMSSYQRAATHSRLFKLLQDDTELLDSSQQNDEFQLKPSRRRIVHNVSITRKQNPQALSEAETMSQRRERLSLPLRKNTSIDADNPSTPNSPASPIMGHAVNKNTMVSDKLVSELVQSLLLKSESCQFKNLPMEKLQAAAKRVLEEELDSLENTSVETTPNMTPNNDLRKDKSYSDYYNTWSDALGTEEILPSKTFKAIQETTRPSRSRSPWTAKCPRVLSSKTVNRDLSRVTESPEIFSRTSNSPECFRPSRESSVSKWRKS